jgi:enediyne biosynthesis protein E4
MNFYNFRVTLIALFSILFSSSVFAQTVTPDTTWFTDVTAKVGLGSTIFGAAIAVDVNNDDYPDLITLSGNGNDTGVHLYINEERPGSTDPTDRIFVDETAGSGLDVPGVIHDIACAADFNNDGNIDLMTNAFYMDSTYNFSTTDPLCPPNPDTGQNRLHVFLGDGKGHFTLIKDSVLESLGPMSGTSLPVLDYDRDGNLDVYVANHYDNWCESYPIGSRLLKGNGDGTFTDVTASSGIQASQKDPAKPWLDPPAKRAYFGANVSDWNNDCWPDIFACPYEAVGYPFSAVHGLPGGFPDNNDTEDTRGYGNLYKNNGDGTFTDVGITANWDPHFAWAEQGMVPWAAMPYDYNNDGYMDYLVLEVHGANYPAEAQYNYPNFPGDGRTCIFTNLGPDSGYKLSPNDGQIVKKTPQNPTHGDHNGIWTDFENNGWADIIFGDAAYAESPESDAQRMFFCLQDSSTHIFTDITQELGFISGNFPADIEQKIRRPAVILPIDYDLDGDDDILKCPYSLNNAGNYTAGDGLLMLRNNIGNKNNHITIKLIAPPGVNKSCIGARVTVKSGNLKQMRDVYGDQGDWTNEYPFIMNFGLGKRTTIDSIDIRWPDANCTHTIVTNVAVNQFVRIGQDGISSVVPVGHSSPNNFELYPNPDAGNNLNLKFNSPLNPIIEIFNSLGQEVGDYEPGYSSSFQLPLKNLPAGLYFVHVIGGPNGSVMTKTFMKSNP